MAQVKITMKAGGAFRGAKSKHVYQYQAGEVLTVDDEDIVHLDKADYSKGEVKVDNPGSKKK